MAESGKRIVLITGASSGIGKALAAALARGPYELILTCRDLQKGAAAVAEITAVSPQAEGSSQDVATPQATVSLHRLDLADFASIESFASQVSREHPKIDVLVNNAGLYLDVAAKTAQGFEMTVGVNHIGPYYLTQLLLPLLRRGDEPQIIQVCSKSALIAAFRDRPGLFEQHPHGYRAYLNSKLMQLMTTLVWAEELKEAGITVQAVHPGVVSSGLWRGHSLIMRLLSYKHEKRYISSEQAARAVLFLIESPAGRRLSGQFFEKEGKRIHLGPRFGNRLWLLSLVARTEEAVAKGRSLAVK